MLTVTEFVPIVIQFKGILKWGQFRPKIVTGVNLSIFGQQLIRPVIRQSMRKLISYYEKKNIEIRDHGGPKYRSERIITKGVSCYHKIR